MPTNTASGSSLGGGGVFNLDSNTTFIDCIINGNSAEYGGGMQNIRGNTTLIGCILQNNKSDSGAGMHNYLLHTNLTNCNVLWNFASINGGMGAYTSPGETITHSLTLQNCLIINNLGHDGGGILNGDGQITANNCIIWYNAATTRACIVWPKSPILFAVEANPYFTFCEY